MATLRPQGQKRTRDSLNEDIIDVNCSLGINGLRILESYLSEYVLANPVINVLAIRIKQEGYWFNWILFTYIEDG